MAFILDADWAIQALAGRAYARSTLDRLIVRQISLSAVTIGELFEIAFNSPNPAARLDSLRRFLHAYPVLTVTEPIALRFAEIRAYLRRRGEMVSDFDIIVGATALEYDLTVLTFNVRHFRRIPDLRIYTPDA